MLVDWACSDAAKDVAEDKRRVKDQQAAKQARLRANEEAAMAKRCSALKLWLKRDAMKSELIKEVEALKTEYAKLKNDTKAKKLAFLKKLCQLWLHFGAAKKEVPKFSSTVEGKITTLTPDELLTNLIQWGTRARCVYYCRSCGPAPGGQTC